VNGLHVFITTGPEERTRFLHLHCLWTGCKFSPWLALKSVQCFTTYTGCEQAVSFHHDWPWRAYNISPPTLAVNSLHSFITTGPEERTSFHHLHRLWTPCTLSSRLALKSVQVFTTYNGCEQPARFRHDWPWRMHSISTPRLVVKSLKSLRVVIKETSPEGPMGVSPSLAVESLNTTNTKTGCEIQHGFINSNDRQMLHCVTT
jgi:hypothetical protein